MNYVLFCDKNESKAYKEMFKNAADSNLLAAESVFNKETIDKAMAEYNPHGIVIADAGDEIEKIIESIKYSREIYDDMRIILIYPGLSEEYTSEVKKYTSDVITRAITAEDFAYIINNRLTAYDINILNDRKIKKPTRSHFKFAVNKKALIIIFVVLLIAFIIAGIIYKATNNGDQSPSEDETTESSYSEAEQETETEPTAHSIEKETEAMTEIESGTSIMGALPT